MSSSPKGTLDNFQKADTVLCHEAHSKSVSDVLAEVSSTENGLKKEVVTERQSTFGKNQFTQEKKQHFITRLFLQLKSPLAFVLVLAFFVTLALQEFVDAFVIAFALVIAVTVGLIQEGKASSAFDKLASSQVRVATVIRGGKKQEIEAVELIPGDIVVLQGGNRVPADVRVISAKKLAVNEAPLTGEWAAIKKQVEPVAVGAALADQKSMAWMGTYVSEGYGLGVVVATGDETEVGKLAGSMRDVDEVETPLQTEMKALSQKMLIIIMLLVVAIFMIGLWQGQTLHDMLLMSIAIAVASVPEGLPAAVTIILAVGMEALLKRGGLVRNLLAAETLGSTTYVLTDKTGTLTEAKMSITGILVEDGAYVKAENYSDYEPTDDLFQIALAAADAYTDTEAEGNPIRGDAVEQAIVRTAASLKIKETKDSLRALRSDYLAFTSENRFAAGLSTLSDETVLCVNGAPGALLKNAAKLQTRDGEVDLDDAAKQDIKAAIAAQTKTGKRLVAVGYKNVSYSEIPEKTNDLLEGLVFCGVLIFDDPVREGVDEAIAGVQSAGARVILITGDNAQTALSIALTVGITNSEGVVLTGKEIESLSDDELLEALRDVSVYARVLPKQKMRIATVLQKTGEVVAMTGDGINDAPALRRANIGVAIGSGTAVAKEASDLVLVEDSFATIYAAIEEGRRIVSNLRKIVGYLLSTSLSEVVLIATALILGAAAPILPAQILWANVIEEGLMSVAYAFEKGSKNAMKRKPQDIHSEGLVSKKMFWFIAFVVTVLSVLNVGLYLYLRALEMPLEDLRSLIFLGIAMDSLFMSFAFRSLSTPVWKIPLHTNLFFIGSFLISVVLLMVVLTVPFFQYLLSYQPQPWDLIILPVVASFLSLATIEVGKWIFFERREG